VYIDYYLKRSNLATQEEDSGSKMEEWHHCFAPTKCWAARFLKNKDYG